MGIEEQLASLKEEVQERKRHCHVQDAKIHSLEKKLIVFGGFMAELCHKTSAAPFEDAIEHHFGGVGLSGQSRAKSPVPFHLGTQKGSMASGEGWVGGNLQMWQGQRLPPPAPAPAHSTPGMCFGGGMSLLKLLRIFCSKSIVHHACISVNF